jgi:hypothetical protein
MAASIILGDGCFGKALKPFQRLILPHRIEIAQEETFDGLIEKIIAALPSSFSWDRKQNCLRAQIAPNQPQGGLKPVQNDKELQAILMADRPDGFLSFWVFGGWCGTEYTVEPPVKAPSPEIYHNYEPRKYQRIGYRAPLNRVSKHQHIKYVTVDSIWCGRLVPIQLELSSLRKALGIVE